MTPHDLFRTGLDTQQIAETLGLHEAEIERQIHEERSNKVSVIERKKRGAR